MNDNTCTSQQNTACCSLPEGSCSCTNIDDQDKTLAQLAKALGHPARVAILRLLIARNECICGEICDQLPLAQSTISQHLKIMKEAGLIVGEVDGLRVCYCVNPVRLQQLKALVAAL
jgi:ArsR family transcriptional regulator